MDLRVLEMLQELKAWAEVFERDGCPLSGDQPCIPALFMLAEAYPETPDPFYGEDGESKYPCDHYHSLLFQCTQQVHATLLESCDMWINRYQSRV